MRRFSPAAALLLLRRSPAALLSSPRCLMRALLIGDCPARRPSQAMAVWRHQWSSVADGDEGEVLEASNWGCSTSTSADRIVSDGEPCAAYVEKLCRSGDLHNAVRILRHLHDEQIHVGLRTINALLQQTGEAKSFALFAEVFRYLLLSKVAPDSTSYKHVARALQNFDDSAIILNFVREILETTHGKDPTVVNCIVSAIAKYGDINKSLIVFEELKKDQTSLDVVTFNIVLDILGKAGQVEQMLREVKLMDELGHSPDIVTYNTVINCLRRLGRSDLCKSFAREMLDRGMSPDLRTYTALVDSFGRAGHISDALEMFNDMKKSHQPSVYAYRALISNLRKAGRCELAEKLTEEMNSSASELLGPEDFKNFKGRKIRNKK